MKFKYLHKKIIYILIVLITNILVFILFPKLNGDFTLSYQFSGVNPGSLQVFYTSEANALQWTEDNSQLIDYNNLNKVEKIKFKLPSDTKYIRLDFYHQEIDSVISDIKISYRGKNFPLENNILLDMNNYNHISSFTYDNNSYKLHTTDIDPFIVYSISDTMLTGIKSQGENINNLLKILLCLIVDLSLALVLKKITVLFNFVIDLFKNRSLIWSLSKNDFKTRYVGNYLGITWAFIQPIVTIITYWFVFQYGLKASSPIQNVPFVLWFVAGLVPWFFFQEALINATNCMAEYSYLVKKLVFNINILPIVKIISSFFIHLVFILFIIIIFAFNGLFSGYYILQLFYYSFCCFILVLSISYATASVVVFFKDLGQFIVIILQILMWMTPIMWSSTILPTSMKWFPLSNPVFYIVDGFRDSMINHIWFWDKPLQSFYFWFVTMLLFLFGSTIFRRLKPHFADVL